MTSSYTVNNGLEKPEAGDQEGAWGGTLNTNFDIIDRVLSGVGSISLSGTTHTLTTTDGTLTDGMYRVLVFTGALGANNTVTISPNDQDKLYFIVNNTTDSGSSGPYSIIIKQGTGATVTVENGRADIVYADGAGSGAAVVSLGTEIGQRAFDLYTYTATAGQTTFTGSDTASKTLAYSVHNLFVTLNGVTLENGTDYTATNGTSVVLTDAATVDDELNIYAFNAFSVANVTAAVGDFSIGDDLNFTSDGAIINMGADSDVTITHVADTGIKLNSTLHLEKSDATAYDATDSNGQVSVGPTVYLENPANANNTVGGQIVFGMRSTEVQARIGATGGTSPSLVFGTGDVQAIEIDSNQDLKLTTDSAVLGFGADNDVTLTHTADTGLTLSAGANVTQYTINSTEGGAAVGPYINLDRLGGSAADSDGLGIIQWRGQNDADETIAYAQIYPIISDASDGSETSYLQLNVYNGGSFETPVYINSSGKVYIYNNDATNVGLRVRQDNASNTNYGVISQTDGTGTAGYFSTAGAGTALYGYCGAAHYGVRGYSAAHYGGYFSSGFRGSYSGASGKKYFIGSYSSTYGAYSNGSYYSATNTYTGSDARLKDVTSQITTSDGILAKVNNLKPIMYKWKENSDGYDKDASPECGFLAQEVKDVFPDLITEVEVPDCSDEMHDNGRDTKTLNEELGTTYGMSYEKLSVYLAAALQEASKKIDALETRIKTLEDAD